jgi:NCAIR mutase (PurE)-related protein
MKSYNSDVRFDWQRERRTGVPEVVLGESKSVVQLMSIAEQCIADKRVSFMTRVDAQKADALLNTFAGNIHYHAEARTLFVGPSALGRAPVDKDTGVNGQVAIVAAGTSDAPVVAEIEQTLLYLGMESTRFVDVGVAGLWRLTDIAEELNNYPVLIAVAGMEGALFSVLTGLVRAPVIAVPSSVGYGVAAGGHVALHSALSSCAPGLAVVNIDNGFGAAALAKKILNASSACDVSL